MTDIKFSTFSAAVVLFEKFVFNWEQLWATKAFSGPLSIRAKVFTTNVTHFRGGMLHVLRAIRLCVGCNRVCAH